MKLLCSSVNTLEVCWSELPSSPFSATSSQQQGWGQSKTRPNQGALNNWEAEGGNREAEIGSLQ